MTKTAKTKSAGVSLFDKFRSITEDGINKLKEPFAKRKIELQFMASDSNSEIIISDLQEKFDDKVKDMVKDPANFNAGVLLEIKRDILAQQELVIEMEALKKEILG